MLIYITSAFPAAVGINGAFFAKAGCDKTVFKLEKITIFDEEAEQSGFSEAIVSMTPIGKSEMLQICEKLIFMTRGDAFTLSAASEESAIRVIDWGEQAINAGGMDRVFELIPEYEQRARVIEPKPLDTLEYKRDNGDIARISLYYDYGLRLSVRENGTESGYVLGSGESGSLRALDLGSKRLIVVHAKGCRNSDMKSFENNTNEKFILFNDAFEIEGELSGGSCFIEDGRLIAVNELETVLLHQQKLEYEPTMEGLVKRNEEIGFFTHPMRHPCDESEKALALMECVLLGREAEAMALLSPALHQGLNFITLTEFFGDLDEARVAPFAKKRGLTIAGAIKQDRAKAYSFEFENGLIGDISELESPS